MNEINFEGHVFEDLMPDLDSFARENFNFYACFYYKDSKKKEMECYCPTIARTFTQTYAEAEFSCSKPYMIEKYTCKNEVDCLSCNCSFYNAKYANKNVKREMDVGFFQKSDRGIVFRAFRLTYNFGAEYVEPQGFFEDDVGGYPLIRRGEYSCEETERIFYNYDRTVEVYNKYCLVYNPHSGYKIGVKAQFSKTKYPYNIKIVYVDSVYEDLKKLLYKTFYNSMLEFESEYIDEDFYIEVYLYALLKYPLHIVMKYGFKKIVEEIYEACGRGSISLVKGINYRGKTIKKVLGFDLSKIPHSLCEDLTCEQVERVRFAIKNDLKLNLDNFKVVKDFSFKELFNYVNVTEISSVCRYILNQNKRYKNVWVSEYLFYLKYAKEFGFDLENKENLYPVNLSTAHDNMVALVKEHDDKSLLKSFYNSVKPYSKVKLDYKDFYISPVLTPMSLRRYADKFHNCSYDYCLAICEGKSFIFVVKSRLEPLIPYYMFEYNPQFKQLVQLRAVRKREVPKEIEDYVGRFVKKLKVMV